VDAIARRTEFGGGLTSSVTRRPFSRLMDESTDAEQVRELVQAAADTLGPADREIVQLAVQPGQSAATIAEALGLDAEEAQTRLSRARRRLERALAALLVARNGADQCAALATMIDGWGGRLTPALRHRVARHIDACDTCTTLLAGYVPVLPPAPEAEPPAVADEETPTTETLTTGTLTTGTVYRSGTLRPAAGEDDGDRRRVLVLSGAALVLLVVLGVAIWALAPDGGSRPEAAQVAPSASPSPSTTPPPAPSPARSAPPSRPVSSRASITPSATRGAVSPSAPAPAPPAAPTAAAPFAVEAYATTRCDGSTWTLLVSASADVELDEATASATGPDGSTRSQPLLIGGGFGAAEVRGLQLPAATWTVHATAADGRTAASAPQHVTRPC
jgi:hypothetical protein